MILGERTGRLAAIAALLALLALIAGGGNFAHADEFSPLHSHGVKTDTAHDHTLPKEKPGVSSGEIHCGANIISQSSLPNLGHPETIVSNLLAAHQMPTGAQRYPEPPPPRFL